eukprot:scaffold7449_cov430-Prasinococcus_capsulatus_cf.AAC.2
MALTPAAHSRSSGLMRVEILRASKLAAAPRNSSAPRGSSYPTSPKLKHSAVSGCEACSASFKAGRESLSSAMQSEMAPSGRSSCVNSIRQGDVVSRTRLTNAVSLRP